MRTTRTIRHPQVITVASAMRESERARLTLALGDATEGAPKAGTIEMTLYTGAPFMQWWSDCPIVIDLAGLKLRQVAPILLDHCRDVECVVGHSTKAEIVDGAVRVSGVASGAGDQDTIDRVIQLAAAGYPFEASIGATPERIEEIPAGGTAEVNGRSLSGPLLVIRAASHVESSVVLVGADRNGTTTRIAAKDAAGDTTMTTTEVETTAPAAPQVQASASTTQSTGTAQQATAESDPFKIVAAKYKQIAELEAIFVGKHPALMARALEEHWDAGRARTELQLAELQSARPVMGAPMINAGQRSVGFDRPVIEAALCMASGVMREERVLKDYGEKTLDLAAERFGRRSVGLQEVIIEAAAENGYRCNAIRSGNYNQAIRAAFSSHTLSSTLGAVANKIAVSAFLDVDQSWREIAKRSTARNFQARTSVRMVAGMKYQKLAPSGAVQSADAGEATYTNNVDTRAILFTISRQNVINDDAGVFNDNLAQMGRGGALALNEHIWTTFLAGVGSFFAAGNNNYFSGSTTALAATAASLGTASQKLREMKDEKSNPINFGTAVMLVPGALEMVAKSIFVSTELRDTTANTKIGTGNPWANTYKPVTCPYLGTAFGLTNSSDTAWWLVASPSDVAVIDVAFLDGVETPTVEQVTLDAESLGIGIRGYFDFGAALMEPRKAVMSKGAA